MKYFTKLEIKWALFFVIAQMLWMSFEKLMGWHETKIAQQAIFTNIFALVAVTIYVLAIIEKRDKYFDHKLSWKQGFFTGLSITILIVLLTPLTQYIILNFISPDYIDNIINYSVSVLEKNREEMESVFNLRSYMLQATLAALLLGVATSGVVSIFTRKV